MATKEERERYSRIDPDLEALLAETGPPLAPGTDTIPDLGGARAMLDDRKRAQNAVHGATITTSSSSTTLIASEIEIPVRDSTTIPARLYRLARTDSPATSEGNGGAGANGDGEGSPLLMMLHGGGFCLGGVENEDVLCRRFAVRWDFVVVNVCYRLAPERRFPGPVEDSWDALTWMAEHAAHLGADPSRGFIVSGVSAGGNLTDVMGHLARDRKLSPPLTGLLEIVPLVCQYDVCPERWRPYYTSHIQNQDAPIMPQPTLDWLLEHYQPDTQSQLFSTFNWEGGHKGLPPVFMVVCGMDVLRDEGLIYERVLREESGVKTRLLVCPGLPHAFWTALPELPASRKVMQDMVDAVGWLLEQHTATGANGHA